MTAVRTFSISAGLATSTVTPGSAPPVVSFTLPAIAGWVVRDWMPEILREKFSLGQGKAGVSAILFVQIASIIGVLIGGSLADKWMQKTPRGRIYTSAIGMLLFLPALFSVGNAGTLTIAIVFLVVFGLGWGAFDCNNMPILSQIVRPELRATGYGVMNLVSISCGGFADWGFGVLQHRGTPLNLIFGAFSAVALLSVAIKADGSVDKIELRRSSGHKLLDDAAINIVKLSAPYAPFPPDIARDTDIIDISRTWRFTTSDRLQTE